MQGVKRKVVYVSLYEGIAIVVATLGLSAITSGHGAQDAGAVAVAASAIAIVWNLVFNTLFEAWEARQSVKGRGLGRRIAHAIGFEGGLILFLVPLIAWWFDTSLWHALVMDLGLVVFFLVWHLVFNWAFDKCLRPACFALQAA